ncbi:MAG: hypothetical protein IH608_11260, partial [Proteobacteria bacterium]|nr:hypothetical protein [Pseudomonadota bacterium]
MLVLIAAVGSAAQAAPGALERSGVAEALLGRWERALPRLTGANRATAYFRAITLLALGMRTEAFTVLRELRDTPGTFSGPATQLAVSRLFAEGDYGGVVAWLDRTAPAEVQDAGDLHYAAGQSRYLLGDLAGARRDLEVVAAGPRRPYALHTLALIHFQEGRVREAVDLLGVGVDEASALRDSPVARALADRLRVTRGQMLYQAGVGLSELAEEGRR